MSGVDCDLVFVAANCEEARVSALESQGLGDPLAKKKSNAASSSPDGGAPGGGGADDDNPDGELLQHEFVSAIVRLAYIRYPDGKGLDGAPAQTDTLAQAFEMMMERHVSRTARSKLERYLDSEG